MAQPRIPQAASMDPEAIWLLRRQACERGFTSKAARLASWPAVLRSYCDTLAHPSAPVSHTDDRQIMLDVSRAMHFDVCVTWSPSARDRHLSALASVLHASFVSNDSSGDVPRPLYYQGCHDVASVLLLELGRDAAADAMLRLLASHFSGIARGDMDVAMILVDVVAQLVRCQDDALVECLREAGAWEHMHVSLAWIITWFAHNVTHISTAARLFDLFIATHPVMPAYVSAALMLHHSDAIRALQPRSFEVVYPYLQRLPSMLRAGVCSAVIQRAMKLYAAVPPAAALRMLSAKQRSMLQERWPSLLRFADEHGDVVLLTPPRQPSLCAQLARIRTPSSLLALHVVGISVAVVALAIVVALLRVQERVEL